MAEEGTLSIPVYFAEETDDLLQIYDAIQLGNSGDQAASAVDGRDNLKLKLTAIF